MWQNGTLTPEGGLCAPHTARRRPIRATRSRSRRPRRCRRSSGRLQPRERPRRIDGDHRRSSIAAVTPEAGFSIGSYLASYNSQQSGVLNAILGTLGTSATVTAAGYQGLANTYVTINQLITASGGLLTSSNVMTTSLTGPQWLAIWSDAVANQVAQLNCGSSPTPSPCNASTALGTLDFSSSTSAQLCQLVSVDGSTCAERQPLDPRAVGQPQRPADAHHRGRAGQRDQRARTSGPPWASPA